MSHGAKMFIKPYQIHRSAQFTRITQDWSITMFKQNWLFCPRGQNLHAEVLIMWTYQTVALKCCHSFVLIKIWNKSNTGERLFKKLQWNVDVDDNDVFKGE